MLQAFAPRSVALAALLAGFSTMGCEGYVKRGGSLYLERRYVEAAEVFERTEARLDQSSPRERAEYGLFRGLTFLQLGDVHNAQRWLAYAYEVERAHPWSLGADRRSELDRGWFHLGERLRELYAPTQTPPTSQVVAASPPLPQGGTLPQPSAPGGGAALERRSFLPE